MGCDRTALLLVVATLLSSGAPAATVEPAPSAFERDFVDATLRLDLYHVGNAAEELLTLDRAFRQGRWAGSTANLVDPTGYGRYRVSAIDPADGRLLFARGFDSYFGEYRTTAQAAQGVRRAYHETLLLPFPKRPIQVLLEVRNGNGPATAVASFAIDPGDPTISLEPPAGGVVVVEQHASGNPHRRLDLAILGEGYTAAEEGLFRRDLERFAGVLLGQEPFASLAQLVSIRGVLLPSRDSGCDEPSRGVFRDTALGASFDALGSARYLLTEDNRALRDVAANVPYDALIVMVNHHRYGGGGIYNFFCTFTAHNQWSEYLLLHELGHCFAGLADEYYTSSVAYDLSTPVTAEPLEPNVTALLDGAPPKWAHLLTSGAPLPTPWEKAEFEQVDLAYQKEREALNRRIADAARAGAPAAELEALEAEEEARAAANVARIDALLAPAVKAGAVGAFEGAAYRASALYRPMVDCMMFSKGRRPFCRVCQEAIAAAIHAQAE